MARSSQLIFLERLAGSLLFIFLIFTLSPRDILAAAQDTSPITSSGLHTQVSVPNTSSNGQLQHNITGGTRVGENLFHSFERFNVPANNVANFLNGVSFDLNGAALPVGLSTSNILARVTHPNPSVILGTIQTTGFDNAHLFLMNPSGIVFGPNASLDVGGSVTFTTADYIRLGASNETASGIFHAGSTSANILISAPISTFGFLSSTAGISVQGAKLSVEMNQSITLAGGDEGFTLANPDNGLLPSVSGGVTLKSGALKASGGVINIVSIASTGEIASGDLTPKPGLTLGPIHLENSSSFNSSGEAGGTIRIQGGSFVIKESTLSSDTSRASGNSKAIDVTLTGDLTISNNTIPAFTARSAAEGTAGEIYLKARNISAQTVTDDISFSLIDTHASGTGHAGNVTIVSNNLTAEMGNNGAFFIDSGISAKGSGGNVHITATAVQLKNIDISTGDFRAITSNLPISTITGSGGSIDIRADTILLHATSLSSQVFNGHGSNTSLRGHDVTLNGASLIGTSGSFGSGAISIKAQQFTMTEASQLEAVTLFASGGDIEISTNQLELNEGSTIRTQTAGRGPAGNIVVNARDSLKLSGKEASIRPSGFYSNSIAREGIDLSELGGDAGAITLTTEKLALTGGARIDTTTQTSGRGGNVTITANDSITISGERTEPIPEDFFAVGSNTAGGIFTRTIGGASCSGTCGVAGDIRITTDSLTLGQGSLLDSSTTTTGPGGNLVLDVASRVSLSKTLADGSPVGIFSRSISTSLDAGSGGSISLTAGQSVTIQDGASVSASSTGPGNAGNVEINAGQQLEVLTGSITTQAAKASGGNIDIRAIDRIRFVNSTVSTSVLAEDGKGGDIFIDPNVVILEGSEVTAKAVGGAGGNITFVTPLFLADSVSLGLLSAKSESGLNGTVLIQSPTSNLSGTVGQLASKTNPPQVLLQNRCVALAGGEQSTFILAGRDALPSEPGGWLSSPVAMEHWTGEETEEQVSHVMVRSRGWNTQPVLVMSKDETTVLSLRRLTPPGFLVRSFAVSAATGCSS